MKPEKLLRLQRAAKKRYEGYLAPDPPKEEKPVRFIQVDPFIADLKKIIVVADEKIKKPIEKISFSIEKFKKNKPAQPVFIPKFYRESEVTPDEKKTFTRPPAEYSNKSPYGIADELRR